MIDEPESQYKEVACLFFVRSSCWVLTMYYDNRNTSRETWKYTYKGYELKVHADAKRDEVRVLELSSRSKLADLLKDPNIRQDDERILTLRRQVEDFGQQYEACRIFAFEFGRTPDREFILSLGDVVYFNLV